jgi:hypothetical protein
MIKLILGSSATEDITLSKSSRAYNRALLIVVCFIFRPFGLVKAAVCRAAKAFAKQGSKAVKAVGVFPPRPPRPPRRGGRRAVPHLAAALQGLQLPPPPLRLAVVASFLRSDAAF